MRWFTSALLLGTAAVVFFYNQRPDRKLVFPLLDLITQDPVAQGWITFGILLALGLLTLVQAVFSLVRSRRVED